ncbi:MAG: hypothetical protein ACYC1T_06865 [Sulfuricaulis sp.]
MADLRSHTSSELWVSHLVKPEREQQADHVMRHRLPACIRSVVRRDVGHGHGVEAAPGARYVESRQSLVLVVKIFRLSRLSVKFFCNNLEHRRLNISSTTRQALKSGT